MRVHVRDRLRAEQSRDGWHLEHEPPDTRPAAGEEHESWPGLRARVLHDQAAATGEDTAELELAIAELYDELAAIGIRGTLGHTTGKDDADDCDAKARRVRSTLHPAKATMLLRALLVLTRQHTTADRRS